MNLALEWSGKKYGLDNIFARVQNENVLLKFDFDRIKEILDKAFDKHTVEESQLKYLQRKYKNIKRHHGNSFTELYMNNLLHLVEHIRDMDEVEFLPDLQETQTTCDQKDLGISHPNSRFPVQFSRKIEKILFLQEKTVTNDVLKYERSECFKLAMSNGF